MMRPTAAAATNNTNTTTTNITNNINNDHDNGGEDDLFEISSTSDDDDHPYQETACDWYHRHVLRRARWRAGLTRNSSSSSDINISSCSSSSSSSGSCSNEILEGSDPDDDFDRDGGAVYNNDESRRRKRKAIRSAMRPLYRWITDYYPLVAARCCLSLDPSSTSTSSSQAAASSTTSISGYYSYNATQPQSEVLRLRRVFRRLHRRHNQDDAVAASPLFHHPTSSKSTMSLDQQLLRIKQERIETESNRMVIQSFLPQGTGISFIDAVLGGESLLSITPSKLALLEREDKEHTTRCHATSRLVLELNGPPRCGMTSILLALAARYVACTSISMLFDNESRANEDGRGPHRLQNDKSPKKKPSTIYDSFSPRATEPRVVILDLEKGVHAVKLALSVREAVLRRWEETAPARQWNREQKKLWSMDSAEEGRCNTAEVFDNDEDKFNSTMNEQRQIELAIASCLGRINIVRPRDVTYLSLVATLEELRHSLDEERDAMRETTTNDASSIRPAAPPTLIMIDSLTALDASTRYLESLPTGNKYSSIGGGSGLSDRNEFYRQLIRLHDEHEIAIFGTSRYTPSSGINNGKPYDQSNRVGGKRGSGSSLWEKMVSHRISLHHVADGTQECLAGYDFVATTTMKTNGRQEDTSVFPYSVTAGGIAC